MYDFDIHSSVTREYISRLKKTLKSNHAADLQLCFHIYKKQVFSLQGSVYDIYADYITK